MIAASVRRAALAAVAPAVALAAAPATGADATVRVTRDRVVVTTREARAVVDRRPFRLRVEDAGARTVLGEVRNRTPRPLATPATTDPRPPGFDDPAPLTLYAPLTFLVGTERIDQYDGGLWGGNLMSGERSGTQYSAVAVRRVARDAGGARLVVSTTDPSGRTLVVRVVPVGCCAIGIRARAHPARGVALVADSFASGSGEGFFGFGGRHNALDQHGNTFSSWIDEENLDGRSGIGEGGGGRRLYPNGPAAAYYPQPEFVSSRRYGFLLDQPQLARFQLDETRPDAWNASASAAALRYDVAPGRAPRAIRTLTGITGRQPVPPRWALGPMLDRLVKNFGETGADYQANVADDLHQIKDRHLPLRAYRIEGWGFPGGNHGLALHTYTTPGEQARVIETLRSRGIHPLIYLRPWVEPDSAPVRKGWVATHRDGRPFLTTGTSGQQIALLDFTNPAAVRYWQRQVRGAFDLGADGFMQDSARRSCAGCASTTATPGRRCTTAT